MKQVAKNSRWRTKAVFSSQQRLVVTSASEHLVAFRYIEGSFRGYTGNMPTAEFLHSFEPINP